jgi:hypothetical protein
MRHKLLTVTTMLAAFGCGAAPAHAEPGRLADFGTALTSRWPGSPTGVRVHVLFHRAGDPNGKPAALRSAVIAAPSGIRFDSGAVSQCTATDAEIQLLGSNACPADSQLTVGSFSAMTGFGAPVDPLTGDDHVFNGPNQLIEIITAPGMPLSPAFDRLTISGSTLTAHPPDAPGGPPDGQTAVRSIDFAIPVRAGGGRSLITSPPICPPRGEWTSTGTFGFADGTADTVVSSTPCTRSPSKRSPRKHRRHARSHRVAARHR